MRRLLMVLAVTAALVAMSIAVAPRASASTTPGRIRALLWAETQRGCWYSYGGESCSPGYDCSGIVQRAYAHVGISLPRTTFEMIASSRLVRIPLSQARRGDLMFFGSGHVELKTRFWHGTFGAQEPGTRVSWHTWGGWWAPTAAYRVRGAG